MPESNQDFAGRVAVITGAGATLGAAYARYLAARGAMLVLNDTAPNAGAMAEVEAELRAADSTVSTVIASLADPLQANELASHAVKLHGRIDIAVHAPAIAMDVDLFGVDLPGAGADQVRSMIDEQVMGALWFTRAVLDRMRAEGRGSVVVTTSSAGAFGLPGRAPFAAATAAVVGLVRSLALEEMGAVRVNAVSPAALSPQTASFFDQNPMLDPSNFDPLPVAAAVAMLCMDSCPLNGEVLTVGGGRVSRYLCTTAPGHFDPEADHVALARNIKKMLSPAYAIQPVSALDELLLIQV